MKIFVWLVILMNFIHAGYSDDLGDATLPFNSEVETIGNLGEIKSIIDLRGFVPVKLKSIDSGDSQWYKVPTKEFINAIYFNNKVSWLSETDEDKGLLEKWGDNIANIVSNVKDKYLNIPDPTNENDISGAEEKRWVQYAYELSRKGEKLYDSIDGGMGYDSAEPIMILEIENSGLIFISFRYKGIPSGQYLVAFELSKNGDYKTFYRVYDTFITPINVQQAFTDSVPIIAEVVLKFGTISKGVKAIHKTYKHFSAD